MAKYVRTNGGKIHLVLEETEKGFIIKYDYPFDLAVKKEAVIKQANTIEELCDEFVILDNRPPKSKRLEKDFDKSFRWFNQCKIDKKDIIIYGAIWTDKGLVYVVKMNEKGELELL